MKQLRNNKGVTGVDVALSVTLIIIVLGIAMTIYSSYANKSAEVRRNTQATNLAMKVIEDIKGKSIDYIDKFFGTDSSKSVNSNELGLGNVPNGYTVNIRKRSSTDPIVAQVGFEIDVTVTYKIKNQDKTVTLSTIKKYDEVGEAEPPEIEASDGGYIIDATTEKVIPIKYDINKNGYVKTTPNDIEWYSISSKIYPIVVVANDSDFDRNGVIQLEQKDINGNNYEVYIWEPSYYNVNTNTIGFIQDGKSICYMPDTSNIYSYKLGEDKNAAGVGAWLPVNEENLDDPNKTINEGNFKDKTFSW